MLWNSPQCVAQFPATENNLNLSVTCDKGEKPWFIVIWYSVAYLFGCVRMLPQQFTLDNQELCVYCLSAKLDPFSRFAMVCDQDIFFMFSTPEYVYIYETIKHFTRFFFKSGVLCHSVIWAYLFRNKCRFNYPLRKTRFPLVPRYAPYFWPSIANGARGRIQRGDKLSPSESRSSSVPVDNVGTLRASVPRVFPCPGANRLD